VIHTFEVYFGGKKPQSFLQLTADMRQRPATDEFKSTTECLQAEVRTGVVIYASASNPSANSIARRTSCKRSRDRCVMNGPRFDLGIVCRVSRFAAQSVNKPSAELNLTSDAIPRILEVIDATVIPVR